MDCFGDIRPKHASRLTATCGSEFREDGRLLVSRLLVSRLLVSRPSLSYFPVNSWREPGPQWTSMGESASVPIPQNQPNPARQAGSVTANAPGSGNGVLPWLSASRNLIHY